MKNSTRFAFAVLTLLAGCVATIIGPMRPARYYTARAQVANAVLKFNISTVGPSQTLPLQGQSSCVVTFTSTGGAATVNIEGSSDGNNTFATLTQFTGSGAISPPVVGTQYAGAAVSATSNALTGIRVNATTISGPLGGTIVCSGAGSGGGGGGGGGTVLVSPIPLPVSLPTCAVALPCVTVSALPAPAITAAGGPVLTNDVGPNASPWPTTAAGQRAEGICDKTTGSNCVAVSAAGAITAATYQGSGGTLIATICDKTAVTTVTNATTTLVVAASGSMAVYICGSTYSATGTVTTANIQFEQGTGATCGGSTAVFTNVINVGTLTTASPPVIALPVQSIAYYATPTSDAVCVVSNGTQAGALTTFYAQHT